MIALAALFNSLRRRFPDDDYHAGFKFIRFCAKESRLVAEFENGREGTGSLLVGGDGAWSTVRQQLLPELSPEYAGYVAWRGLLSENAVPTALLETFLDKFTFFEMPGRHILCYVILGSYGVDHSR